ncbi:hypothetical protein RJ641_008220 [Dillenia turbinata]|uniref:Uncharacterized protein n=1 Tax=Dillenia turbinata TaxID=194707 RepID=A0AAN8VAB5_9MAGN
MSTNDSFCILIDPDADTTILVFDLSLCLGTEDETARTTPHMSGQRMENRPGHFEGRQENLSTDKDHHYANSKVDGQWQWERDGAKVSNQMQSHMFNEGAKHFIQAATFGAFLDLALPLVIDQDRFTRVRGQIRNLDWRSKIIVTLACRCMKEVGYEENPMLQTFEELELKFRDEIIKLSKEQTDAEDAENARHKEKINAIHLQYEEQLAALRARHATWRDEFLLKESNDRKAQYQEAMMGHYPNSGMASVDPRGYGGIAASVTVEESNRAYNPAQFDSYREQSRFLGGPRDHGYEARSSYSYPGGSVYDTGAPLLQE